METTLAVLGYDRRYGNELNGESLLTAHRCKAGFRANVDSYWIRDCIRLPIAANAGWDC